MDDPAKETKNKSRRLAKRLFIEAEKNEPQITADLQTIALEVSSEMVGLENKFKTVQSLTRKITKKSSASAKVFVNSGYQISEAIEKSTLLQAARINDALRYTFIFSFENYVFGFKQTLEKLRRRRFEIPEYRI